VSLADREGTRDKEIDKDKDRGRDRDRDKKDGKIDNLSDLKQNLQDITKEIDLLKAVIQNDHSTQSHSNNSHNSNNSNNPINNLNHSNNPHNSTPLNRPDSSVNPSSINLSVPNNTVAPSTAKPSHSRDSSSPVRRGKHINANLKRETTVGQLLKYYNAQNSQNNSLDTALKDQAIALKKETKENKAFTARDTTLISFHRHLKMEQQKSVSVRELLS